MSCDVTATDFETLKKKALSLVAKQLSEELQVGYKLKAGVQVLVLQALPEGNLLKGTIRPRMKSCRLEATKS